MDNDTIVIAVVVVLTVLGFAGIATWAVMQGTKPHLPNGRTYSLEIFGCLMHVENTAKTVAPYELSGITRAIGETAKEWSRQSERLWNSASIRNLSRLDSDKALKGMIVLLLGDDEFEKWRRNAGLRLGVVAYQSRASQTFGSGPYMLVIKRSSAGLTRLVVHETCHALSDYAGLSTPANHGHGNRVVWGPGGIEEAASSLV